MSNRISNDSLQGIQSEAAEVILKIESRHSPMTLEEDEIRERNMQTMLLCEIALRLPEPEPEGVRKMREILEVDRMRKGGT